MGYMGGGGVYGTFGKKMERFDEKGLSYNLKVVRKLVFVVLGKNGPISTRGIHLMYVFVHI